MGETPDETPERPATERAEEVVDRLAQGIGRFAALASLRVLKVAALVREEAEDMWAEAQNIRQERGHKRE